MRISAMHRVHAILGRPGRQRIVLAGATAALLLGPGATAAAQDQSVSFGGGYFALRGADARIEGDVLFENQNHLIFELDDFNWLFFGGEYHIGIGPLLEAGLGMGYYRRTVPAVYRNFVDASGREIEQDLRLRIIPVTAVVRFMPLGRGIGFEPYVGGGIGLYRWRYSETGQFIDFRDGTVFTEAFVSEGLDPGPILLGGVRGSFNRQWGAGGEARYQRAEGRLEEGFVTDRIDLGGIVFHGYVHFRF
jgi:hypothetical protein